MKAIEFSKNHVAFFNNFEYYTFNEDLYRAPTYNPIGMNGFRQGGRFEATKHALKATMDNLMDMEFNLVKSSLVKIEKVTKLMQKLSDVGLLRIYYREDGVYIPANVKIIPADVLNLFGKNDEKDYLGDTHFYFDETYIVSYIAETDEFNHLDISSYVVE